MKRLFNMRMSENSSVVDHLNDFNGVTNQLESFGINLDDKIRALLFLCLLPNSWNNLVRTVSNSTISGTLTLNDVVSSMMNDKMRRKTTGDGISSTTALSVESRVRQNNKQNKRGRSPTRGRSKSRGKSKSKGRTILCWNCNKEGHKKNDCTEPKKKKGGRQGDDEGANMVSSNEWTYDDLCLSAIVDDNFKVCENGMRILYSKNALPGMKHIQLRYHFIRSLLEDEQLNLEKIEGNRNLGDMLAKVVNRQKLSLNFD
ncbi:hypothetical protein RJ640_022088 [Escallonia rubra]|uniref:CCHC-type domain-containing protein n=1 Tax=Escallonia rubra TaxID=112253 RepID=A0AA88UAV5_9ASTE|nr:hypothetical protein RJ640_022088 [Escallonia rubra]